MKILFAKKSIFSSYLILSVILILNSCSSNKFNSFNLIDGDYQKIKALFNDRNTLMNDDNIHIVEKKDSLIVLSTLNQQPWEGIFLFKNEKCYYQKMNIYCSECADKMVNDIIKDKNFKFEAISPVNYLSKRKDGVILRFKDKLEKNGNCSEITIHRIKESAD